MYKLTYSKIKCFVALRLNTNTLNHRATAAQRNTEFFFNTNTENRENRKRLNYYSLKGLRINTYSL